MEEFLVLARCLEPLRLPTEEAIKLFNKLSDKFISKDVSTRLITFQRFAIGCVENELFSPAAQEAFLQIKDKSQSLAILKGLNPIERLKMIKARLHEIKKDDAHYGNWITIIEQSLQTDYTKTAKVILIKIKLLEAESARVFIE